MACSPRSLPTLPLEILEQIVDFHGEVENEEWREYFDAPTAQRNHSTALLACHMVSKQFRVCALRLICRKTFVNLDDTPERLRRLQDVLSGEDHALSQLCSPTRFIKEIDIFLTDHKVDGSREYTKPTEAIASVLKTIADRVPMGILSIFGSTTDTKVCWSNYSLAQAITQGIEEIIRLPSVSSLNIISVGKMPYALASLNTHLHSFSISESEYLEEEDGITLPPFFGATLPNLESLTLSHCSELPQNLEFPSVLTIEAKYQYLSESETAWGVIQRSSQTLTSISISDCGGLKFEKFGPSFPKHLDLTSFPQLEAFMFTYFYSYDDDDEKFKALEEIASFLNVKRPMPNLQTVDLSIFLDSEDQLRNDSLSRIGKYHIWGSLDRVLASGYLTGMKNVQIYLDLSPQQGAVGQLDDTVDLHSIVQKLDSDITDSFSRSKTLAIPLEVDVSLTYSRVEGPSTNNL